MRTITVEVTYRYTLKIDDTNYVVQDYTDLNGNVDDKAMVNDCADYRFDKVLPVIETGGVTVEDVEVIEVQAPSIEDSYRRALDKPLFDEPAAESKWKARFPFIDDFSSFKISDKTFEGRMGEHVTISITHLSGWTYDLTIRYKDEVIHQTKTVGYSIGGPIYQAIDYVKSQEIENS